MVKTLQKRPQGTAMILFVGENGKVLSALDGQGNPLPPPSPLGSGPNESEASAIVGTYIMTAIDVSTGPDPGTCCWKVVNDIPICKKAYCV